VLNTHYCIVSYKPPVVWFSASVLVSISAAALHWARWVLGWVTICGWINHLGMYVTSQPGWLNLLPSMGL